MINPELPYASRRSPVLARNIVATSQPLAAMAGLRMLLAGGNAVDAALAAAIALTVVEPTGNGLGGDAFAIIWDGSSLHGLNASGRSPAKWTPERFAGLEAMPQHGWDSVTVPGAVSAWVELSSRFGDLPFETLFEPAIDYARNGYNVSPDHREPVEERSGPVVGPARLCRCFMPDGRAPGAGDLFRNVALAESLRDIALTKGASFYQGRLAERMAAAAAENGAVLTLDDLAAHGPRCRGRSRPAFAMCGCTRFRRTRRGLPR